MRSRRIYSNNNSSGSNKKKRLQYDQSMVNNNRLIKIICMFLLLFFVFPSNFLLFFYSLSVFLSLSITLFCIYFSYQNMYIKWFTHVIDNNTKKKTSYTVHPHLLIHFEILEIVKLYILKSSSEKSACTILILCERCFGYS